jgi:hypothetical protein
LIDVVAGDVLELADQNARLCPFAVGPEADRPGDRLEAMRMDVVGHTVLVQDLGCMLRLKPVLNELVGPRCTFSLSLGIT